MQGEAVSLAQRRQGLLPPQPKFAEVDFRKLQPGLRMNE
jgi:hypothetical protein